MPVMPLDFTPTLAKVYDPRQHTQSYWIQAKVDGVRCIATKEGEEVILYTRHGNLIKGFNKIRKELKNLLNEGDYLDGELYSYDLSFEEVCSSVRTGKGNLLFIIFDFIQNNKSEMLFSQRWNALQETFNGLKYTLPVEQMEKPVRSKKSIEEATSYFVQRGFEGAILRSESKHIDGRNDTLLKNKPFQDDEFTMTDFEVTKTGRFMAHLINEHGQSFKASCARACACSINKKVTVRFQGLTSKGIPRFARVITARDYE